MTYYRLLPDSYLVPYQLSRGRKSKKSNSVFSFLKIIPVEKPRYNRSRLAAFGSFYFSAAVKRMPQISVRF
jgi:hypothetical protein